MPQINETTKEIKATFTVPITTDTKEFRRCVRAVYDGTAEDHEVNYVLSNVVGIKCGKRPPTE